MKKIFRMALVIALAGASLLYTGCTKDYGADIAKVGDDLSKFQTEMTAKVNDLEGKINSLNSAISSLESAYKAADAALQKAIDANAANIKALQGDVATIKADITALQGKVAANEAAIAEIKADLANYATKKELADAVEALEAKIAAATTAAETANAELQAALEDKIDALQKVVDSAKEAITANAEAIAKLQEAQDAIDAAAAALASALRSIVFVPELYYAGIEATEYLYAYVLPLNFYDYDCEIELVDHNFADAVIPAGEKIYPEWAVFADFYDEDGYLPDDVDWAEIYEAMLDSQISLGSEGHAYYNLNPSTFNVDDAEWALKGYDKKYVIKGEEAEEEEEAETWAPVFQGITANAGVADVTYTIKNPAFMNGLAETVIKSVFEFMKNNQRAYAVAEDDEDEDDFEEQMMLLEVIAEAKAILSQVYGVVSIMNLEATLEDGAVIASDYEAIVGTAQYIDHLAFSTKNKYVTNQDYCCDFCYALSVEAEKPVNKCLYPDGEEAIEEIPSVPVYYNCGSIDLAQLITIHVDNEEDGEEVEYTLAELQALYGQDFTMEFETIKYTIGANDTSEDAYAIIEGSEFFPAYVSKSAAGKYEVSKCGTEGAGVSAIGRFPVVLVTLKYGDTVVAAGYFKVEITEEEIEVVPEDQVFDLSDFGEFPYICAEQEGKTLWHEYSANILEALKVKYADFLTKYQLMTADGATVLEQGTEYEATLYIKDAKGNMVEPKDKKGNPIDLGKIIYKVDAMGNGVNDIFIWKFDKDALENFGDPQVVYICFVDKFNNKLYFSFTAAAAAPADVTYGDINPSYWFDEVENEALNTVRVNVRVPNVTADDVLDYSKDLDDNFIGNQLKLKLAEESEAVYGNIWDSLETSFAYAFAAEQPKFDGVQFVINEAADSLFAGEIADSLIVATLTADGVIKYDTTEIAKQFLNKYGHLDIYEADGKTVDQDKLLYANVIVAATYDTCEIEVNNTLDFHARFLRPVDFNKSKEAQLVDALPTGDNVEIGKLFTAVDWQGYKIFGFNSKTKKYEACWYGTVINWYEYYGFTTLKVDFENVKTDQTGEWALLSEVNPAAKLFLAEKDGETVSEITSAEADITNVENLAKYVIHYENNMGVVKDFHFSVPVQIVYSWGTISFDAEILVKETYTQKNN